MILAVALLLAQDWPSFLGPERDGRSPERGVQWPPRRVWAVPLGESFGSASVRDGRAYVFDRAGEVLRLRCLDLLSGAETWSFTAPTSYADAYGSNSGPRCCPVVDGDLVFAYGPDGLLYAVREGKLVWKRDTMKDFGVMPNFFGVGSTPIVEGDLLLVHVGGSPKGSPALESGETKPNGSAMVAFDKRTGETRWQGGDDLAA